MTPYGRFDPLRTIDGQFTPLDLIRDDVEGQILGFACIQNMVKRTRMLDKTISRTDLEDVVVSLHPA